MHPRRIVYYECANPMCGLRFPELRGGLKREICPMCKQSIHPAFEVASADPEIKEINRVDSILPLECLLDNIRSNLNVGSIFRSAEGIGIRKLILGGITPTPENPGVQKTALGAEKSVIWEKAENGVKKIDQLKSIGYCVWGLEATRGADSLYSLEGKVPPLPLVLVVGNEVCGIDPEILEICDRIISIPMVGNKQSYNVAIAFGIAASYIRYCQILSQGSDSRLPNIKLTP